MCTDNDNDSTSHTKKKEIEYLAIKACALMIELSIRNMVFPSALL